MNFKLSRKQLAILLIVILSLSILNIVPTSLSDNFIISSPVTSAPLADIEPPVFGNNSTASTATTGDPFTFSINVTDNISVNVVTVNYTWSGAGQWFNKTMAFQSGITWINNSQMPTINTTITYYFWANDTSNLTSYTGPGFINVFDNDPPVIISNSENLSVKCSTPFMVYANFTDNVNVTSAKIFYRTDSNVTYRTANMTEEISVEGNFYVTNGTMDLNIYNNTENISYYVIAYDDNSNWLKINNTGGEDWNITVIDDVLPVAISGSGYIHTGTGDSFEIWANFTDNINTTRAVIFFRQETQAEYFQHNMTPNNNQGEKVNRFFTNILNLSETSGICTINCTTPIDYYVLGYDEMNNSANYTDVLNGTDWNITIVDNDPPVVIIGSGDLTVTTGDPFTIYVNFSDNIKLSHATIYYKRPGEPYLSKSMNETPGKEGNFFITLKTLNIDTYNDDSPIYYYVMAYDLIGLMKKYGKPNTDYKISIVDNDAPSFHSGNNNLTIGTGDTFDVNVNFTDNIKIKKIQFFYKHETWGHWEVNEFSVDDGNNDNIWEFEISSNDLDAEIETSNDDSDYFYYIRAFDGRSPKPNNYNYSASGQSFRITVYDDDMPESVAQKDERGSGNLKATTGEPFTIFANFTDNIEVDSASLFIRPYLSTTPWQEGIEMTQSLSKPGRFWISNDSLNINTTTNDSDYEYFVSCFDTSSNEFKYEKKLGGPFVISVIDNDKPIAEAGLDVEVEEGTIVEFDSIGSSDNIGIVTYSWSFIYDKLERVLEGDQTSFKFETTGNYKITLTIFDAQGNKGTDEFNVVVVVKNYPPEIESVMPGENDEVYVFNENLNIYVRFTEDMDIDKNDVNFFFINDSAGEPVPGKFNWFVDEVKEIYQLTFIPDTELQYDETYTVTITTGVKEKFKAGFNLKSGKTWSFSTFPEDSDGDKLPDWWEVKFFPEYNINEVGPDGDDDDDGFTNMEEYLGADGKADGGDSTNPRDGDSHPPKGGDGDDKVLNLIIVLVIIIIIILVLIIISIMVMIRKRKRAEEEEAKKPKVIEHEILFEGGETGLPGQPPAPTVTESTTPTKSDQTEPEPIPPIKPPETTEPDEKSDLEVELEPALETEEPLPDDLDLDLESDIEPEPEIGAEEAPDGITEEEIEEELAPEAPELTEDEDIDSEPTQDQDSADEEEPDVEVEEEEI